MKNLAVLCLVLFVSTASSLLPKLLPEPTYTEYAKVARWAVARTQFGTLSTTSVSLGGIPWGNVASVSDGIHSDVNGSNATGVLYFYLTSLDETSQDLAANPVVSFAISKATFPGASYCGDVSAEDPTCVRVTLSGKMITVTDKEERAFGIAALYSKHPAMIDWPTAHDWQVWKLNITNIFLLDFYGGAHPITLKEYHAAELHGTTEKIVQNLK